MKIYRNKSTTLNLCDFEQWLFNQSESVYGKRIGISWKRGKRRKLRSYTVIWEIWECDCCGPITSVNLTKGGKTFQMDNHFGPGSMDMSAL